jgi:hypothetical protein
MPEAVLESMSELVPLSNCPRNHSPIYIMAGMGMNRGMIRIGTREIIVLLD